MKIQSYCDVKGILTQEHIRQVERESVNTIYRIILTSFGSDNPLSILKVSPKGLIFIRGTDDTGWMHIQQRHSGISGRTFWTQFKNHKGEVVEKTDGFGQSKLKLDNPSPFHPYSIPVYDYITIADQIYLRTNLNEKDNKIPELFDVYDGIASGLDGNEVKYRLLTYKNSRIVHTMFPLTKVFSGGWEPIVHYARQSPKSTISIPSDEVHIEVPYKDEYEITRYVVIIRTNPQREDVENWYIQLNAPNGNPILTYFFNRREKDMDISTVEYLERLERVDFSDLENIMKKMEKSIKIIKE